MGAMIELVYINNTKWKGYSNKCDENIHLHKYINAYPFPNVF